MRRWLISTPPFATPLWSRHASSSSSRRPFPVLSQASLDLPPPPDVVLQHHREHRDLVALCRAGGGEKGVARHTHINKKILVRERLAHIFDSADSFFELGSTSGMGLEYGDVPCAGTVTGIAPIHGVNCMIAANDGTVKGGTSYPITVTKSLRAQEIAHKLKIPTIYIVDSGGAFLPLQSEIFPDVKHGGRTFRNQAVMSSQGIPQVALVAGLCTAGGAYTPTMSDEAIIVHRIGNIYLGGPPLVKAATGEVVSGEDLGGATLHCGTSGITDHFAQDEHESFRILRDVVASLNLEEPEMTRGYEEPLNSDLTEKISGLDRIQREECYALIASLVDGSRFSEFKRNFGGNLVAGFAFIKGRLTGWLINCGPITAADSQKGAHFVQLCDARDIPLVFLQNASNNGKSFVECDSETLKERAKFVQSQSVVRVPKVTVNVGGASTDENFTMCGPSFDPLFYLMWPRSWMSRSDPFLLKTLKEMASKSADPASAKKPKRPKLSKFEFPLGSAQFWASRNVADEVILPQDTRDVVSKCLELGMLNFVRNRDIRGQDKTVIRM